MKAALFLTSLLVCASALANDVDPFGFEQEHFVSARSRADVLAELQAARANDELPVGELGVRFVDLPSTKTRAQVAAETLAAARLGLLQYGELGPRQPTAEQAEQIRLAGLRARAGSGGI